MPFTGTHVLAIVPFGNFCRWEVFLALAIGSVVPDIAVFVPSLSYRQFHSPAGVVFPCVPVGLLAFAFVRFLGLPLLLDMSPDWIRQRVQPYFHSADRPSARLWVCVVGACLVGSFTHVAWDSFTHSYGLGVEAIPRLRAPVSVLGFEVPLYKALQHGSSVIGLPLLALYGFTRLRKLEADSSTAPRELAENARRWFVGLGFCLPLVLVVIESGLKTTGETGLAPLAVSWIRWSLLLLVVGAAGHSIHSSRRTRKAPGGEPGA